MLWRKVIRYAVRALTSSSVKLRRGSMVSGMSPCGFRSHAPIQAGVNQPPALFRLGPTYPPVPLRTAAFVRKLGSEGASIAVEFVAGIAFVAFVDFGKCPSGAKGNFLARHVQILQRARWRRTFHAEQRRGDGVEVGLVPIVLGHARRGVDGCRVR